MSTMPTNKEICEDYLNDLRVANEQWFNGYHWEVSDQIKLVDAIAFFQHIANQQRKKLIKEGRI